ncbi:hypothetical protein H0H87_007983 [Tephrocybe sp. NHM501043]|nr:hypothetical protein H0H87_007983 [Tephrocybe sp. NHM501043]
MAETLLAILLVTSSSTGSNLVYRWPPSPSTAPRLSRARPTEDEFSASQLDNPWRASHFSDAAAEAIPFVSKSRPAEPEVDDAWHRPHHTSKDGSSSASPPASRSGSGRNSPSKGGRFRTSRPSEKPPILQDYDHLFGYSSDFLASLLCPQPNMCHQKFELLVDNLAFIGHPVCEDEDGTWRFKPEKLKPGPRGRESKVGASNPTPRTSASPDTRTMSSEKVSPPNAWLNKFHLVIVLDIPDPSSSASGNVSKYFEVIYEQVAFTVTAVLFQEQVVSNFVETECEILTTLKDSCISKGESFSTYALQALEVSSIAPAMKALYEAIKASEMAYITLHNLPLEVQLPPYLDSLLHNEGENDLDYSRHLDNDEQTWGQDMRLGWKLSSLQPWKKLSAEFDSQFNTTSVPSLPVILTKISSSVSKQTDNHFFASVVQNKDLIPIYHDVVLWMLKRDLLVTLHLRIRVVATLRLKKRVSYARFRALIKKPGISEEVRQGLLQELQAAAEANDDDELDLSPATPWLQLSPRTAHRHSRNQSPESGRRRPYEYLEMDAADSSAGERQDTDQDASDEVDDPDSGWNTADDFFGPTMISDPGKATVLQRRWLAAMSEGKDPVIAKRFQQ